MIDIATDELLTPDQLAERIPAVGGKRTGAKQIRRWIKIGIRGVRLEALKIGPSVVTTWRAFEAFTRSASGQPTPKGFEPSEADRIMDRQLESMGV